MVLYLRDAEVRQLIEPDDCISIIEQLFRDESAGLVENRPTVELNLPKGIFRLKAGGTYGLNTFGYKAYPAGGRYTVYVYDLDNGLDGVVEARGLTEARTGAVSAVATKYMAREDAKTMGIIGTGREARAQLTYITRVRPFERIKAYSRSAENRETFAKEMTEKLGIEVVPVDSGEECVRDVDVITTITGANEPVLEGAWVAPGTHINAVGATTPNRRELDDACVGCCGTVVVELLEGAREEIGELLSAARRGLLRWDDVHEIKDIVSGKIPGRTSNDEITLFDSVGVGAEDVGVATYVLRAARAKGAGTEMGYEPPYMPARRRD